MGRLLRSGLLRGGSNLTRDFEPVILQGMKYTVFFYLPFHPNISYLPFFSTESSYLHLFSIMYPMVWCGAILSPMHRHRYIQYVARSSVFGTKHIKTT